MVGLLIWDVCVLIFILIAKKVMDALELDGNVRKIVMLILALVILLSLFSHIGVIPRPF